MTNKLSSKKKVALVKVCDIADCTKTAKANGWCSMHYQRWVRHGDPTYTIYLQSRPPEICSIEGCSQLAAVRGWCNAHYLRWLRHGDPLTMLREPTTHRNLGQLCPVDNCGKPCKAKGLCSTHYGRWLRNGTTSISERQRRIVTATCSIEECGKSIDSRGWCTGHYARWRMYGDPLATKLKPATVTCIQDGCGKRVFKAGVCRFHHKHFTEKFGKSQADRCAICQREAELKLDHDHKTRVLRGLLCHSCNVGLGHFKDSLELLAAAIAYLAASASELPSAAAPGAHNLR